MIVLRNRLPAALLCAVGLVAAAAWLYWPSVGYELFVLDDVAYVGSTMVTGGLSGAGLAEAFGTLVEEYWIPLTWVSYMADVEWFGADPAAFHRTNVWDIVVVPKSK